MESNIESFKDYYFDGKDVIKISNNKTVKQTPKHRGTFNVKLKDDNCVWRSISIGFVKSLAGVCNIPSEAIEVPYTSGNIFITEQGVLYSKAQNPSGRMLKILYVEGKYPTVTVKYKGSKRSVEIHQLMCVTFIDKDYIEKGLVCLHKDDNKLNFNLCNLSVGTYSKNNKDAYTTGVNSGNVLGINC